MKWLLPFVAACTTARLSTVDPQLHAAEHGKAFVLRDGGRVGPDTEVRFQNAAGEWTDVHAARDLHVDDTGLWLRTLPGFRDVGWHWHDITAVEVANISGPKTFGAIVGYTALTAALVVVLAPVALVSRGGIPNIPIGGGGGEAAKPGSWAPEPSDGTHAPALFSTGARVRSIASASVALDTSLALHGDMIGTGAIARVTLAGLFELGGGVRVDAVRDHGVSTTGLFQAGLRLPIDEHDRFAVPLGVEIGGGGAIAHDLRLPWGLRGTRGRWTLTVSPATAEHVRIDGVRAGRWGLTSGFEIAASL